MNDQTIQTERENSKCAQCKKAYRSSTTAEGFPKCAPGVLISESEFQKPILPSSKHPRLLVAEAFEWLRVEATKAGADKLAGVAFEEWEALTADRRSLDALQPMAPRHNPEDKTPAKELRAWLQKNLEAMRCTLPVASEAICDDDHDLAIAMCDDLLSQARGLRQMIESAKRRHIVLYGED